MLIWHANLKVQTWFLEVDNPGRISSVLDLDQEVYLDVIDSKIALAYLDRRLKNLGDKDAPDSF